MALFCMKITKTNVEEDPLLSRLFIIVDAIMPGLAPLMNVLF